MRWIGNRQTFLVDLHFLLTLGLTLFPLLSLKATALFIGLWALVSIAGAIWLPRGPWRKRLIPGLTAASIYLLLLVFRPFSPDPGTANFELEKMLSLVLFPLCWVLWPGVISSNRMAILMRSFILACFLAALWPFAVMTFGGLEIINGDFSFSFRTEFERLSGIHPTYMSILVLFAAAIKLHRLSINWSSAAWGQRLFDLILLAFFLSMSLLLASRTPLAAFFVLLPLTALLTLRNRKLAVFLLGGLGVLGIVAMTLFPSIRSRLAEMNPANLQPPKGQRYNSVNVRAGIFLCSAHLIKNNWLTGVGTGEVQNSLNNCYGEFRTKIYKRKDYNSHNQYLHFWMAMGIGGIVIFVMVLAYSFFKAVRLRHPVFLFFIAFFALCCLTENLLARQMGVVFFALFNSLFLFNLSVQKPVENQTKEIN